MNTPLLKDFEREAFWLLENSKSRSEDIETGYRVAGRILDGFTKTGIKKLEIKQNTLIEVKQYLTPDTIYLVERLKDICSDTLQIDEILIIYGVENTYSFLIKEKIKDMPQYIRCMSLKDLKKGENTKFIESKPKGALPYEKAQSDFSNGQNAFIVGAGVSKSVGLPLWDELLVKIIEKLKKSKSPHNELKAISEICDHSAIIEGRYILHQEKEETLQKYIQEILLSYPLGKFDTIDAIVEHIINNNIDAILTYNYDDLIERRLEDKKMEFQYYSIYGNNRMIDKYFPIYHLHGLVSLYSAKNKDILSTPKITEQQYHQLYKQQYHWSNITLLHALNTKTCFFIGLSMNDPNLRRLLDYYASENYEKSENDKYKDDGCRHYIFMRKEPFSRTSSKQKNIEHWRTIEDMYNAWGIDIIWFDEFEELPDLIRNLKIVS